MAMTLSMARININKDKEELIIDENNENQIITPYIDKLINGFIVEREFYEIFKDEFETISYKIINDDSLKELVAHICEKEKTLFENHIKSKALKEKNNIVCELENIAKLKNVIIQYFIISKNSKTKFTLVIY